MGEDEGTADETTFDQRIGASLALAAGTPDASTEELLDDRRLALRWSGILLPVGFALFGGLVIGLAADDGRPSGPAIILIALGLLAVLIGGVHRCRVDRRRLADRRPDSVFTRRERLLLLGNVRTAESAATARPSLPVLTEVVRWRLATGWADPLLISGAGLAWITANQAGRAVPWWQMLLFILLAFLVIVPMVIEVRALGRYRRFLIVSAAWTTRVDADRVRTDGRGDAVRGTD